MKIYLILFLLYPFLVSADRIRPTAKSYCSNISLRPKNEKMKKYLDTPRDQGAQGWCHSYAIADVLSWEYNEPLSAVHVGLLYSDVISKTLLIKKFWPKRNGRDDLKKYGDYSGGTLSGAYKHAINSPGICKDSDLKSTMYGYSYTQPYAAVYEKIEEVRRKTNLFLSREAITCQAEFDYGTLAAENFSNKVLSNLTNAEINSEIFENIDLDPRKILMNLIDKGCEKKVDVSDSKLIIVNKSNAKLGGRKKAFSVKVSKILKQLNINLEQNKMSAITYDTNLIKKKERKSFFKSGHFSTVIGRKWNPDKKVCEFNVKNSWGTNCESYRKDIACNSSNGSFWVTEKELDKMTSQVAHIEK